MQTLIDGAVITQSRLENVAIAKSKPGVIPVLVTDPWLVNNPFEPKTATKDYNAETHTWTARDPADIYIVTNQTYLAKPTTAGFGGPIGGVASEARDTFIPGKN
jgi:hypothetical protein